MKQGKLNVNAIAQRLTNSEGKTRNVAHGDVREIVALVSDLIFNDSYGDQNINGLEGKEGVVAALYRNGERRARRSK